MEFKEYEPRTTDSGGEKKGKKKIKNKWFFIGLIGVVVLVVIDKLRNNTATTEESGYYQMPLGYSGATFTSDGSQTESYVNDALGTLQDSTQSAVDDLFGYIEDVDKNTSKGYDDIYTYVDSVVDSMSSSLADTEKRLDSATSYIEEQNETIHYQNVISAMKSNSDRALITTSQAEKDSLHVQNENLASSIGAVFNDADGYWYKDGQKLYSTELQTANANQVTSSIPYGSSSSGMSYSQAIAQMESNSKAYNQTSDQSTKNSLYQQNQEIGKSLGLTYDSASGKWKDSSGNDAWNYNQSAYNGSSSSSSSGVKSASSSSSSSSSGSYGVNSSGVKQTATTTAISNAIKKAAAKNSK